MFKDTKSYQKAVKRVAQLRDLQCTVQLSQGDQYELELLTDAVMDFEFHLDAEYKAEHAFMERFENHFLASMER